MAWCCSFRPTSNRSGMWTRRHWIIRSSSSAKTSCARSLPTSSLYASPEELAEYMRLLGKIKQELLHPVADTYNLIVSVLYYLLLIINRAYAAAYRLPVEIAKNNYAFQYKDLLEQHIRTMQRVQEYADKLRISRITLNASVMAQLKQRLLEELKNELLFSNHTVSELADDFHFSDPSHLMRFFKQQTGKTFTQYLQDYRNGIYE